MTKPAIIHIGNVSLILGQRSWQHWLVCLVSCVWNARWLPSKLGWERRERGLRNESVIVCHFTLLISVNNHPCVDVWKCAPQVSETSISMSNGAPGQWKMHRLIHIWGCETYAFVLRIIYGGSSVKRRRQSGQCNSFLHSEWPTSIVWQANFQLQVPLFKMTSYLSCHQFY